MRYESKRWKNCFAVCEILFLQKSTITHSLPHSKSIWFDAQKVPVCLFLCQPEAVFGSYGVRQLFVYFRRLDIKVLSHPSQLELA